VKLCALLLLLSLTTCLHLKLAKLADTMFQVFPLSKKASASTNVRTAGN
jgi:hypothetical protein